MAAVEQAGLVLEHHDAEAQVRTENDGSSRQAAKSKGQAAADNAAASADFALVLNSKISELESRGGTGCTSAERDSVKARRKGLRELQKFVTDKANSLEDKIAFVQAKYTLQVHAAMQLRGGGRPCKRGRCMLMIQDSQSSYAPITGVMLSRAGPGASPVMIL